MQEALKASRKRLQHAERAICSLSSPPRSAKVSERSPGGSDLELFALRRDLEFQKSELAAAKHALRQKEYFVAELLDYLDAELSPEKVSSWQWYRRLVVRLK